VEEKKGRARLDLKKGYHRRSQFAIHAGTVFEASHFRLHL
jgi:hypothetical protein